MPRSTGIPLAAARAAALLVAVALPAFALPWTSDAGEAPVALLDASADRVLAHRTIPDPARRVGEVRLVARGTATVVQTLLSTRLLERVTSEIRRKEEKNWPAASPAADDSAAYLAALDATREAIDARMKELPWDRRQPRLLIEFVADAKDQAVLLGTFRPGLEGKDPPVSREILHTLAPSRDWVLRDMRLILADSFDVDEDEVDAVGDLGPAAKAAVPGMATPPAASSSSVKPSTAATPRAPQPSGEGDR